MTKNSSPKYYGFPDNSNNEDIGNAPEMYLDAARAPNLVEPVVRKLVIMGRNPDKAAPTTRGAALLSLFSRFLVKFCRLNSCFLVGSLLLSISNSKVYLSN